LQFDGTIDAALVRRLVDDQFPQWAGLPIRPVEPGGWDNRTFRLGPDMLVRLPSAERYAPQVVKEQTWLPRLAPHLPLPIPEPIGMGRPAAAYPWPWSIYRWIEGTPAGDAQIDDMPRFAADLAGFLRALHRIGTEGAPSAGVQNFHRGGNLAVYEGQTRAALATLEGRLDTARAGEIWDKALATRWRDDPVWVHGDIAPGNMLTGDGALSAVIDFGGCAVGDPASDLVIAWTFFDAESRAVFMADLSLDGDTWDRARGWALWKGLITLSGIDNNQRETETWRRVVALLLDEHETARRG
jgi:aminoglycoside phosphotransferase (APT) family kinase protein